MVVQYILIALVAFVASMDEQLFGITMLGRPLFTSLFVGLILGDVQTGCIVGAALESMFMGAIMVGAAVLPRSTHPAFLAAHLPLLRVRVPQPPWHLPCLFRFFSRSGGIFAMRFRVLSRAKRLMQHSRIGI